MARGSSCPHVLDINHNLHNLKKRLSKPCRYIVADLFVYFNINLHSWYIVDRKSVPYATC